MSIKKIIKMILKKAKSILKVMIIIAYYLPNQKINKIIKNKKYVHLMFNDRVNAPFVDLLNRNFDQNEHIILCKRLHKYLPFPKGNNVIEIQSLFGLNFSTNKKVLCHSLGDIELVYYLYIYRNILREKAYWMIWGGDLYDAKRNKVHDFVRSNFKGYGTDFDEDIVKNKYALCDKPFYRPHGVFPISLDMIHNAQQSNQPNGTVKIQINNRCDAVTIEMLETLSKFENENIKITTIVSYGNLDYKDKIIQKGKEIFGDKFEYIDVYMSPQDYANHLSQNDILILNHNRQQGVGNIIVSLVMNKKVFIRETVSTYAGLKRHGFHIYDSNAIQNLSFDEFKQAPTDNSKRALMFFDESYIASCWKELFDAE